MSRVVGEPSAESRVVGEPLNDHIGIRMCELACVTSYHWRLDTPSLTHPCCCALRHLGLQVSFVLQLFVQQSVEFLGRF